MATILSHAIAAVALASTFGKALPRTAWIVGAVCSMAPDLDVFGFALGVHYEDLLGHRGLTHSLVFAAALAAMMLLVFFPRGDKRYHRGIIGLYLFLATLSHGVLDAFTDGGLGVAFLSPFDQSRYFFEPRPISVSPIGVGFFSARGLAVLQSELFWIMLPSAAVIAISALVRKVSGDRAKG